MASILTFKDIQDRVLRVLDETSTGSPTTLALVKDFINDAHRQRCLEFPWSWMIWPTEVTFSTTSGTRLYTLHEEFGRPLYMWNRTTKCYLTESSSSASCPLVGPCCSTCAMYNPNVGATRGSTRSSG